VVLLFYLVKASMCSLEHSFIFWVVL